MKGPGSATYYDSYLRLGALFAHKFSAFCQCQVQTRKMDMLWHVEGSSTKTFSTYGDDHLMSVFDLRLSKNGG